MLELFRRHADTLFIGEFPRWLMFAAKLAFWPLLPFTLFALALVLGVKQNTYVFHGPFLAETSPPQLSVVVNLAPEPPARWWREPMLGDTMAKPFQSFLQVRINDREIGPPHCLHADIRTRATRCFSHWGSAVLFSLPPGVTNGPETVVTLHYNVRPYSWVTLTLVAGTLLLGYIAYGHRIRPRVTRLMGSSAFERSIAALIKTPYVLLFGLLCAGAIGSALFLASSLYALAAGWALPTTALIRWSSIAEWAARNEPYLPYLLLMLAALGASMRWLLGLKTSLRPAIEPYERLLYRLLFWSGYPIAACAFIFCLSAMMAGVVRPNDRDAANIAALIPFSDSLGYVSSSFDQARDGTWSEFALRRPLAAAFRTNLLFLSNYSVHVMLILQACLLAAAACFAAGAVAIWRGIWAAIAFFALTYIYVRVFSPTTLTEPLGLIWAFLSIPFFIESFRSGSARSAQVAFAMTAVGLMTRMGSMMTIPALLVWLVLLFGRDRAAKLRIGIVSICILVGVLGVNSHLQRNLGTGENPTTGNFAYVLCGLTMGTGWDGCVKEIKAEDPAARLEAVLIKQLYAKAWENFQAQPAVFFARLVDNTAQFSSYFPEVLWRGYGVAIEPDALLRFLVTCVSLIGIAYIGARRSTRVELTFWALVWTSILISASIIFADDGARSLAVSQPLIALFFAIGFGNLLPNEIEIFPRRPQLRLWRYGVYCLLLTAVSFACLPWIAHQLYPAEAQVQKLLAERKGGVLVFGGRRMTGFLVIEDGSPLRSDVPTLHLSEFKAIIEQSQVETYQGLVNPVTPPLPFGFVFTPRLERGIPSSVEYIVPAKVIERSDVEAWRFQLGPWDRKPGGQNHYWFYVTNAEPLQLWSR